MIWDIVCVRFWIVYILFAPGQSLCRRQRGRRSWRWSHWCWRHRRWQHRRSGWCGRQGMGIHGDFRWIRWHGQSWCRLGAGSPPQAIETNRTTDKTSSEMWSFTISSLVQGGLAILSLTTALIQAGPCSTSSAGPRCSLPTILPNGPGVSNEENSGLWSGKKPDAKVSLLADTL